MLCVSSVTIGFLSHYDKDFRPTACRFMADCVAHLAATVERMMDV